MQKGEQIGREEGREEGKRKKAIESAVSMLNDNVPTKLIQKYTGLSFDDIKELEK
jgi:predicted transposase/invertase (TIGR01784 family)